MPSTKAFWAKKKTATTGTMMTTVIAIVIDQSLPDAPDLISDLAENNGVRGLRLMKVRKKIYGDRGIEVVNDMYGHPFDVVPVLLARMKQKDEEWRFSQVCLKI